MSLSKCQICGQGFLAGEMTSEPSQHFCIELNGPGVTEQGAVVEKIKGVLAESPTSEDGLALETQHALHTLPTSTMEHNPRDLAEIGRLHVELEHMKSAMGKVEVTLPGGQNVRRRVSLPGGEEVIVEVAVLSK